MSEVEKLVEKWNGESRNKRVQKAILKDYSKELRAAIAKDAVQIKQCFTCYLDVDEKHPELYGQCILPRDDDGIGFALMLEELHGKHVLITIEETPDPCHPEGFVYRKAQPKGGAK